MNEPYAVHRAPFVLVPQYFGCTVFDRSTSKYLPFDHPATNLLLRLRSEPFDQVLSEQKNPLLRQQWIAFFEDFYDLGWFTVDGRFAGAALDVQPPSDHLVGPLAVHLEVVAACNLTCTHCFAGTLPRKERPLTLHELDELFACLASMGAFRLGLTGGEPLLRKDIFDVIDLAVGHGLHPCITTNALLINERIACEFAKRDLVWLNVSLEGATADTNDRVRGKDTFEKVLERLSVLSAHARFTLAFTIMRTNLAEIEQCAELASRVGAAAAVFRPLYPVGTARQNLDLMPTFAEYNEALNKLARLANDAHFGVDVLDPFSAQSRAESQAVTSDNYGCGAGNQVCSISVSGDVNPCSFLGQAFVAANLRSQSFADIWHNSQGFREMRELPGPSSADGNVFAGGCRARALTFNGSVNARDPWIADHDSQQKTCHVHHPSTILEVTQGL